MKVTILFILNFLVSVSSREDSCGGEFIVMKDLIDELKQVIEEQKTLIHDQAVVIEEQKTAMNISKGKSGDNMS